MSNETEIEKKQREDREFAENQQQGIDSWTKQQEDGAKFVEQQNEAGRKYYENQQEMLKQGQQQGQQDQGVQQARPEPESYRAIAQAPQRFEEMKGEKRAEAERDLAGGIEQENRIELGKPQSESEQRLKTYQEAGQISGAETAPNPTPVQTRVQGNNLSNPFSEAAEASHNERQQYLLRDQQLSDQIESEQDPVQKERMQRLQAIETAQYEEHSAQRASTVCGALGDNENHQRFAAEAEQKGQEKGKLVNELYEFDKRHGLLPEQAQQQGQQRDQEQDQQQGPQQGQQPSQQQGQQQSPVQAVQPAEAPAQQKPLDRIRAQNAGPNPDAKVDPEVRKYAAETKENIAQAQAQQARSREQEKDKSLAQG